jgi:hypothetical protein
VQFEEMNGWNADSDAASMFQILVFQKNIIILLMGDLEGKIKVRALHRHFLKSRFTLWMSLLMIWILKLLLG